MLKLFDQDYATEAYGQERERIGEIKGAVKMSKRLGTSIEETIHSLVSTFVLTTEEASRYIRRFWKK